MEQESLLTRLQILDSDVSLHQATSLDPSHLDLYAIDNHGFFLFLWPVQLTFLLAHLTERCDHDDKFHILLPYHRPETIYGVWRRSLSSNEDLVTEARVDEVGVLVRLVTVPHTDTRVSVGTNVTIPIDALHPLDHLIIVSLRFRDFLDEFELLSECSQLRLSFEL